jgi:hypothetical protein
MRRFVHHNFEDSAVSNHSTPKCIDIHVVATANDAQALVIKGGASGRREGR